MSQKSHILIKLVTKRSATRLSRQYASAKLYGAFTLLRILALVFAADTIRNVSFIEIYGAVVIRIVLVKLGKLIFSH
jgi:hypothetical protein